jgi:hypothetical protein
LDRYLSELVLFYLFNHIFTVKLIKSTYEGKVKAILGAEF